MGQPRKIEANSLRPISTGLPAGWARIPRLIVAAGWVALLAEASAPGRNRVTRVLPASRCSDRPIVRAVVREISLFAKLPPRFAHTGHERMPTWPSQHTAGR